MEESNDKSKGSPEKKSAPQANNMVWYILGLMVLLLLVGTVMRGPTSRTLKWSELEKLILASNPNSATPDKNYITIEDNTTKTPRELIVSGMSDIKVGTHEVTGMVFVQEVGGPVASSGEEPETADSSTGTSEPSKQVEFRTPRLPYEDNLQTLLTENNIEHTVAEQPSALLSYLPMLMLTGMLLLLMVVMLRRMGGAGSPMAFGRSKAKLYAQEEIEESFESVAGVDEAVDELREVVDFLKNPDRYQRLGGRIPKGVMLVGPPGTGKTLLAKAVAGEAGVPFFSLSGSDFVEMFVGVGAARVRDMFQQAGQRSPSIIFIDELDALGKTRGSGQVGGHDEREQTLNALLVEMDGFGSNSGVIVLAASNRPETLDPALLRPGRFDRHVLVDRPDITGREEILNVHLKNIRMGEDVVVRKVAAITSGFVGADLANIVNEAALLAARNDKESVGMEELNEAVERTSAGLEKKKRIMQDDEKLRVAFHESGHALVAYSLPNTDPVHKVSIIPRGLAALGYTMQRPEQDRFLMTQGELESRIQVLLGGTVAEELVFEDISSGAQNDLERATAIARSMVMDFGMSRLGRVNFRESNRSPFLTTGGEMPQMQSHSEETAREIDEEVRRIIDEGLERVRDILSQRRAALDATAHALIDQEVINSEELARLVDDNSPSPLIVPGTTVEPKRPEVAGEADSKDVSAGGS